MNKPKKKPPSTEPFDWGYNAAFQECTIWILDKLKSAKSIEDVSNLIDEIMEVE